MKGPSGTETLGMRGSSWRGQGTKVLRGSRGLREGSWRLDKRLGLLGTGWQETEVLELGRVGGWRLEVGAVWLEAGHWKVGFVGNSGARRLGAAAGKCGPRITVPHKFTKQGGRVQNFS